MNDVRINIQNGLYGLECYAGKNQIGIKVGTLYFRLKNSVKFWEVIDRFIISIVVMVHRYMPMSEPIK